MKERGHLSCHYLMMEGPNFLLTQMKSVSLSLSIEMRQKLFRTLKLMNLLKVLMNHHNLKNRMFFHQQENIHQANSCAKEITISKDFQLMLVIVYLNQLV